jgi:hypothetical protein
MWCPQPNTRWRSNTTFEHLLMCISVCTIMTMVFVCTIMTMVFVSTIINCCLLWPFYINMCIGHTNIFIDSFFKIKFQLVTATIGVTGPTYWSARLVNHNLPFNLAIWFEILNSSGNTSRDVVINDVTLTSLKTPEWSQLVFCDDFVLVTMVASHLFISDEIGFSVTDVSPIYDEFCVIMDLISFYDKRFWS